MRCMGDDGGLFDLRIKQLGDRVSEVSLEYRRTFYSEPMSLVSRSDNSEVGQSDTIKAGGVTLICLEPFRKWRVLVNGMMK